MTGLGKVLKSFLHALQSLEFIYEKSLFPEPEYIFKHALTQEVAYNSLLLKRRRELHERIGLAIEELYPQRLEDFYETLAYHYSRSENADKAVHYLRLSGDKATRDYANWEAVRLYEEAARILDAQPDTEETKRTKLEVFISILDPAFLLGFPEGSIEFLERAEGLAEELGDESSLAVVYRRFALFHSFRGDLSLSLRYSEKCFDTAEKAGDVEEMAMTAFDICTALVLTGNLLEAAMVSRRVIEVLEENQRQKDIFVGMFSAYSDQCGWCGLALGVMGEFEEAKAVLDKGLENALEIDDLFGAGFVDENYAFMAFVEGDADNTIYRASKAIERFEETGIDFILGTTMAWLGLGHMLIGEFDTAREHAEKGLEIHQEVGIPVLLPGVFWSLSLIYLGADDPEQAAAHAEESLRLAREYQSRTYEAMALLALGRAVAEEDRSRAREAEENIRRALSMAEEMMAKPFSAMSYLFMGEVLEIASRREEAMENLRRAEVMYLEMGVIPVSYWLTRTREALARLGQV